MVIANCSSSGTLVSLGLNRKSNCFVNYGEEQESKYVRTEIVIAEEIFDDDSSCFMELDDNWMTDAVSSTADQYLYLPSSGPVDVALRSIPQVVESADQLLANCPRVFNSSSSERVIYVGQGEVAHATPSQCDVIASDKATTCHILALLSQSPRNGPLVSMAHIDVDGYSKCIRSMINEHKRFAFADFGEGDIGTNNKQDNRIEIDVHIMGGFQDEESQKISDFLFNLLAQVASEQQDCIKFVLKTCAISSMNDNGHACPIGRGIGIDLRSRDCFLAKVDSSITGPCPELRAARLWSSNGTQHQMMPAKLSIIHTCYANKITIEPFHYEAPEETKILLQLPDQILLKLTSTSPDVEEPEYCESMRNTLQFIYSVPSFFGAAHRPAYYRRIENTNEWKPIRCFASSC